MKKFVEQFGSGASEKNREPMLRLLDELEKAMEKVNITAQGVSTDKPPKRQRVAKVIPAEEGNKVAMAPETDEEKECTDVILYDPKVANAIAVILEQAELLLRSEDQHYVEQEQNAGVLPIGYVYVTKTKCLKGLYKIGATFRTASQRIKELSRTSVPDPFVLVACVPTPDPFGLERKVHEHFSVSRINGKSTEFFKIKEQEVLEYFHTLNRTLFKDYVHQ